MNYCDIFQQRCYEYFEEKESKDSTTEILVYRGCMEPQECQERKGQNGFYCCSSEHCNDGEYEDKDPVPGKYIFICFALSILIKLQENL